MQIAQFWMKRWVELANIVDAMNAVLLGRYDGEEMTDAEKLAAIEHWVGVGQRVIRHYTDDERPDISHLFPKGVVRSSSVVKSRMVDKKIAMADCPVCGKDRHIYDENMHAPEWGVVQCTACGVHWHPVLVDDEGNEVAV